MTHTVEVNLLDQKLKLKTDSDEATVQSVVDYVSRQLEGVQQGAKEGISTKVALLTCLNIAAEFFRYRSLQEGKKEKVSKKIIELLTTIDSQRGMIQPSLTGSDG